MLLPAKRALILNPTYEGAFHLVDGTYVDVVQRAYATAGAKVESLIELPGHGYPTRELVGGEIV